MLAADSKLNMARLLVTPLFAAAMLIGFGTTSVCEGQQPMIGGCGENNFKVVCYYTSWSEKRPPLSNNRSKNANFDIADIDTNLCTHVIYSFAILDPTKKTIAIQSPDTEINLLNGLVGLKKSKPDLKVLLGIGGWVDSKKTEYSKMVGDPTARKKFIDSVMDIMQLYNFDGLDMDWEYPSRPQAAKVGNDNDKEPFADLLHELKERFATKYLLTAAVGAHKSLLNDSYNVPRLSESLDFINLMTYDFAGAWTKKTAHVAPSEKMRATVDRWVEHGAPKNKLVVGMPMYGRGVTLDNPENIAYGASGSNASEVGEYTGEAGYLSYFEICDQVNNGFFSLNTASDTMTEGPFVHGHGQWVSFDTADAITRKSEYVKTEGLGGAMIWALDLDDYKGEFCGCGKYPLLSAINRVLRPNVKIPLEIKDPNTCVWDKLPMSSIDTP